MRSYLKELLLSSILVNIAYMKNRCRLSAINWVHRSYFSKLLLQKWSMLRWIDISHGLTPPKPRHQFLEEQQSPTFILKASILLRMEMEELEELLWKRA